MISDFYTEFMKATEPKPKKEYWKFWFKGKSGELSVQGEGYICCPHDNIHAAFDVAREEIKESFRTIIPDEGFPKLMKLKHRPKGL